MLRIFNAFSANSHCGVRADVVIGPYNNLLDKPEFEDVTLPSGFGK